MPISALVLTAAPARVQAVLRQLSADPRFSCGAPQGERVPLALDTRTLRESRDACQALLALPGVQSVDLVSVDFADETS